MYNDIRGDFMSLVTENTGKAIRTFRKKNKLTVQELADRICKSKATVSKYESGKISLDLDTLFDIAQVLQVRLEQLLYMPPENVPTETVTVPNFFKNLNHMYIYMYDGRNNHLNRTIINVFPENQHIFPAIMYMNIKNYDEYQNCENTYTGTISHYDALTTMEFQNQDTYMEKYIIRILASFLDAPTKWAMGFGVSSRPLMPVATKMLISKKILPETDDLIKSLMISKEDIRRMKQYNMLSFV